MQKVSFFLFRSRQVVIKSRKFSKSGKIYNFFAGDFLIASEDRDDDWTSIIEDDDIAIFPSLMIDFDITFEESSGKSQIFDESSRNLTCKIFRSYI